MQSFTLAQIERAIQYWRKHHARTSLQSSSFNGAIEEESLTALYRRMLGQRLGVIALDQLTHVERIALDCLPDVLSTPRSGDR